MRDGFAYVKDAEQAQPGEVVLSAFASGGGSGVLLDLSPDGRLAVTVGSNSDLSAFWVEIIEVATGARRTVYEGGGRGQWFLHAVLFDATGESIFLAVRAETLLIHLTTGQVTRVASYQDVPTPQFNTHVLRPTLDQARRRLVVFDQGTRVRVVEAGRSILDECLESRTTECRAARISPSGRLLALYRVSRGLVYGHADAKHDLTNKVEIWDIDAGAVRATIPFTEKLDAVGFDPTDQLLIVAWEYAQGPVAYDLASGAERWRFPDPWRTDRLATAYTWSHSPDGKLLAVGRDNLAIYDATTLAEIPTSMSHGGRIRQVSFSADGSRLATAENATCVVRRVR
jgi:WD40 repeat protein